MNNIMREILLSTIFTVFLLFSLFSQDQSYYENWEQGYALYYPSDWFREESYGSVSFCSNEKAFDFGGQGVGLIILTEAVSEYGPQDSREALREVLKEEVLSDYEDIHDFSLKIVGEEEWVYIDIFKKEDNYYAEFYAIIKQEFIYVIGIAYWPPELTQNYENQIEQMLDSFTFIEKDSGQRYYENRKLGVSFSFPGNWHLEERFNQVMVTSANVYDMDKGIIFAFMKGPASEIGIPGGEECNAETIKDYFGQMLQLDEHTYITWLGKEWLYCTTSESEQNTETILYILVESDIVYLVIAAIHPSDLEEEYRQGLDVIMDSFNIEDFGY